MFPVWRTRTHRTILPKTTFKRIKESPDGVSPIPTKPSPVIRVEVNGHEIEALVDTGSTITLINGNLLKELHNQNVVKRTAKTYKTANNGELRTIGLVKLAVKMNDINIGITAEVAESICASIILGRDWCYQHDVVIDFRRRLVTMQTEKQNINIPFSPTQEDQQPVRAIEVTNQCQTCEKTFESRNKLMEHLKESNHGNQSPLNKIQTTIFEKIQHLHEQTQRTHTQFMINKYQELFDTSKPSAIKTTIHHTIRTGDHYPIYHHPRRTSNTIRHIIRSETEKMLKEGIIRPSSSPWSSPVVIVKKKDGTPRFCVDYRKINSITEKDVYPLPRIDEIIEQLSQSSWYTKLDLKNGYFQAPISEQDKKKTAFATPDGLFEFNRLPQGLVNSPPTFQRLMNETLGNLRWKICVVYLDDIVIHSKSFEQHLKDVDTVCSMLNKANFKLNVDKCELFQKEITFLGYKINKDGMSPSNQHVASIKNFPQPTTAKHAYAFVQTANYFRKFIRQFAEIAAPLTKFNKKDVQFTWGTEEQTAFDTLKHHLASAPILILPNDTSNMKLQTDASDIGIGGVLLQLTADGYKPVGYASRLLTKTEKKYPTIEKEALALWWCVTQKFKTYLQGQRFIVETDHRPLIWLNKQPYNNARVDRWGIALQEFEYEIKHIAGTKNQVADCLSRYPVESVSTKEDQQEPVAANPQVFVVTRAMARRAEASKEESEEEIGKSPRRGNNGNKCRTKKEEHIYFDDETLRKQQQADTDLQKILQNIEKHNDVIVEKDGVVYKKKERKDGKTYFLRYIPKAMVKNILFIYHDSTFNGSHFGIKKTFYKIRNRFFWPNQFKDIAHHISSCIHCNKNNYSREKPPGHLQPVAPPEGIMDKVAMDFVGPLPVSKNGNRYVIVLTDTLSKFTFAKPVRDCTSTTAAKFLVEEVILKYGVPKELITDNGTHFTSSLFETLLQIMGCCHIKITPYHAQANGQCERYNATFMPKVLSLTNEQGTNWDEKIAPTTFNYNNTWHATTKLTPFQLMFARDCRTPADFWLDADPLAPIEHQREMKRYIQMAKLMARTNIHQSQTMMKRRYDRHRKNPAFEPGDQVVVANPRPTNKLSPKYIGPYTVKKRVGNKTYQVQFQSASPAYKITIDRMRLVKKNDRIKDITPSTE